MFTSDKARWRVFDTVRLDWVPESGERIWRLARSRCAGLVSEAEAQTQTTPPHSLNSALLPFVKVALDPSQIIAAERNNNPYTEGDQTNSLLDNRRYAAGTYTIFKIPRSGDTRGGEWFDRCVCIGQGGSLAPSQTTLRYSLGTS